MTAATMGMGCALEYPMPLFEYECRGCGHHFEYLTRDGRPLACPSCAGADLQKLLSAFAVGGNGADRKRGQQLLQIRTGARRTRERPAVARQVLEVMPTAAAFVFKKRHRVF